LSITVRPLVASKSYDDSPDHFLDLPLGLVAVIHIPQPHASQLEQVRDIIAQWAFQIFQVSAKPRPKALR
jgi:hypothetical protein